MPLKAVRNTLRFTIGPISRLVEGEGTMFEQINNPDTAVKKTRNEWLAEGAIILAVVVVALGGLFYALY